MAWENEMNLHNEIMNIPVRKDVDYSNLESKVIAYKVGHRDARHEAAEMSIAYEHRIAQLEAMLLWYIEEDEIIESDPDNIYWIEGKYKAMKLLGMEVLNEEVEE